MPITENTKLYLTNFAAGYTPPTIRGAWDDTAGQITKTLSPVKEIGDNTSVTRSETNASANFDVLLYRGVSVPIDVNQTIDGNIDVVIGVDVSAADSDFAYHIHVYVTQGDTDTPRGTLLTDYVETLANEWPSTDTVLRLAVEQALSSVAAIAGDRIVVEIGYVALNVTASSRTGELFYGTRDADDNVLADAVAGGNPLTTPSASYIAFDDTITFEVVDLRDSMAIAETQLQAPTSDLRDSMAVAETQWQQPTVASNALRNSLVATETLIVIGEIEPSPAPSVGTGGLIEMCFGGSFRTWLKRRGA